MQRHPQLLQHLLERLWGVCLGRHSSVARARPGWVFGAPQRYVHMQLRDLQQSVR